MGSSLIPEPLSISPLRATSASAAPSSFPLMLISRPGGRTNFLSTTAGLIVSDSKFGSRKSFSTAASSAVMGSSTPSKGAVYIVGDFMTGKEDLHVVKPSTTVDEALEALVEYRITGFPVVDDDWKLVGVVSDYDLLALDSISGNGGTDASMFPEVDSSWKVFNQLQRLLTKTDGKVVADVMTSVPVVVRQTTNLEDAARLLLETRYRRLPVVNADGKLVGIITRGNVIRAALQIKRNHTQKKEPRDDN